MSVRTTISLPDDLKARMDAVTEQVNWSAEAAKCFEKVLGGIAARKSQKDYSDVIARLRASKMKSEDENYDAGHAAGIFWAENNASYPELKRAVDYDTDQIGGQWLAPWRGCDWIAFALLGLDVQELLNDELEERSDAFWAPAGGAQSVDSMGNEFLIGFIEGAVQVWNQVRNQL